MCLTVFGIPDQAELRTRLEDPMNLPECLFLCEPETC